MPISVAGNHTLRIEVTRGMAQGWVTLSSQTGATWTVVTEIGCTSPDSFGTCQNQTTVPLSSSEQYRWDFRLVSLPTFSETQGGRVLLTPLITARSRPRSLECRGQAERPGRQRRMVRLGDLLLWSG